MSRKPEKDSIRQKSYFWEERMVYVQRFWHWGNIFSIRIIVKFKINSKIHTKSNPKKYLFSTSRKHFKKKIIFDHFHGWSIINYFSSSINQLNFILIGWSIKRKNNREVHCIPTISTWHSRCTFMGKTTCLFYIIELYLSTKAAPE